MHTALSEGYLHVLTDFKTRNVKHPTVLVFKAKKKSDIALSDETLVHYNDNFVRFHISVLLQG